LHSLNVIHSRAFSREIDIESKKVLSGLVVQAIPHITPDFLSVERRYEGAPQTGYEAVAYNVSEIRSRRRRGIFSGTCPERHYHVRFLHSWPYMTTFPQSKIDGVIVLQSSILKGSNRGYMGWSKETLTWVSLENLGLCQSLTLGLPRSLEP